MMFEIFTAQYHADDEHVRQSSELLSLISEPIPVEDHGDCCSIPLAADEGVLSSGEDRSDPSQVCRICYSAGDLRSLIAPCECSGTMGILHQDCLERWLEISNTTKCEICQHEFDVIRYPKSLIYFLIHPLRSSDIRYLINDLVLFVFLTAIISWLVFVCISKLRLAPTFYDGISFIVLPCSVLFIYVVWCWVSFRYHIQVMKEWRSVNQLIRVIDKTNYRAHHRRYPTPLVSKYDVDQQYSLFSRLHVLTGQHQASSSPEVQAV